MVVVPETDGIGAPVVINGPWTREARQALVDREMLQLFIEYFGRSMRSRRWSPWHDLPVEEIRELGPRLSEDTIDLVEGFYGIEEYIGDFIRDGLESFAVTRHRRNLHLQWGAEEFRHGVALEQVLIHSGARTEAQIDAYGEQIIANPWSHSSHGGVDGILGASVYAMVQERATYVNYEQLRLRVRAEYGLPPRTTPEEARRGRQVGAAEALRLIAHDEIAHHGIFLKIGQLYLRYFPEETIEKLHAVNAAFHMPALRLIPNRRAFLGAVRRTRVFDGAKYRQLVFEPMIRALGLENVFPPAAERVGAEAKG
jgi:acyl-[acyl-carrier-protein] desaturase